MTESKEALARRYMRGIERNYPGYPSTFGHCSTEGCNGSGRGSGECTTCYQEKLTGLVGSTIAREFVVAVMVRSNRVNAVMDALGDDDGG